MSVIMTHQATNHPAAEMILPLVTTGTSLGEGMVVSIGYGTEMQFYFTHANNPPGTGFTKHIGPNGRSHTVDPALKEAGVCTDSVRSTTDGSYWSDQRCDEPGVSHSLHVVMHRTGAHTCIIDIQGEKHSYGACTDITPGIETFDFYRKK